MQFIHRHVLTFTQDSLRVSVVKPLSLSEAQKCTYCDFFYVKKVKLFLFAKHCVHRSVSFLSSEAIDVQLFSLVKSSVCLKLSQL